MADDCRAVRKFQTKDNTVSKLVSRPFIRAGSCMDKGYLTFSQFAKHFKVEEQVKFLQDKRTGIGVGTPARLMDLIDNGILHSDFHTPGLTD